MSTTHPYEALSQDLVMDAVESLGYLCDARVFPLNSYENRVYQVGIEEEQPLIAKFYRPGRWTDAQIQEEHDFLQQLLEEDLPVVAPVRQQGNSLFEHEGFRFCLFPRRGGHAPELSNEDDLEIIGRWLGRLHQVGAQYDFEHRLSIRGIEDLREAAETVLSSRLMPTDFEAVYQSLIQDLERCFEHQPKLSDIRSLRLHGDMHTGNLLLRDEHLWFVDFDDCVQGPAMQDIWMLLSGQRHEQTRQLDAIREGYEMFREFPYQELKLIEQLRTLRICRYAAWLCARWDDPAFPAAFSWFEGHHFWSQHILTLREQIAALQEEPLTLGM